MLIKGLILMGAVHYIHICEWIIDIDQRAQLFSLFTQIKVAKIVT